MDGQEQPVQAQTAGLSKTAKAVITAALIVVVALAIYAKGRKEPTPLPAPDKPAMAAMTNQGAALTARPRLVDLGSDKCIPCKMMAPVLDELKREYDGQFDVAFFDVWKDSVAKDQYRVEVIPTQIFFDASGKELFRHEGFFAKEDILKKWQELGVNLGPARGK